MKSFPSAFTKNDLVQEGVASTNIKQTLKNIGAQVMNSALGNDISDKKELGENLRNLGAWKKYNYNESLSTTNFSIPSSIKENDTVRLFNESQDAPRYEDVNKIPALVLDSINNYKIVYSKSAIQYGPVSKAPSGEGEGKGKSKSNKYCREANEEIIARSLFNPWFGIRSQGFTINSPLMYLKSDNVVSVKISNDSKEGENEEKEWSTPREVHLDNVNGDFTDCSIKTLVDLKNKPVSSRENIGPGGIYRYADFMYCRDLGKISNNHLITLRRFTHPVGDNIFKSSTEQKLMIDKGRLVTWFGTEDNKLEDICQFNYKSTWKEFNSKIQDVESREDDNKLLPSLIEVANPPYNEDHRKTGFYGNNAIYQWVEANSKVFGVPMLEAKAHNASENMQGANHRDDRLVWTPKNTIQSTHIYEGKIEFNQQFNLTFNYELRAYAGINPKTAFLDLLGNILEVTARRGAFWGGARRWLGAPRNQQGWKKANQIFSAIETGIDTGIDRLFGCSTFNDVCSLCGDALKSVGNLVGEAAQVVSSMIGLSPTNTPEQNKQNAAGTTKMVAKNLLGMLKNKLGRPAVYALDAIATGENVGLWHVTIGNPRNPIMTMGNLILEDSKIQQYGPLGIDDFPTGLKVTVTLKHARPRDLTDISSMYTCGQGGLLLTLNSKNIENYFNLNNDKDRNDLGFGNKASDPDGNINKELLESLYQNISG